MSRIRWGARWTNVPDGAEVARTVRLAELLARFPAALLSAS